MQTNLLVFVEVIASIATVIAAIYGVGRFIDSRIERKIRDSDFLRGLASSLRPSAMFDESGAILVDQGGMALMESIEVSHSISEKVPSRITIRPNRHLAYAPLVQTLENELVQFSVHRGERFTWVYDLDYVMLNDTFSGMRRFRVEVIL